METKATMKTKAFKIQDLRKAYPGFTLGPLELDLDPGVVLGYVGPNASGKTTTFHCLTRLVRADSGSIEFFGRAADPDDHRWKLDIGYVGDKHAFFEGWTGEANLRFRGQFFPDWSQDLAKQLARRFECPIDQKAKDMSSGNRVKLSIIGALSHSPRLLLLDEPTIGLDPVVRREVLDALFEILEDGERSIFYATHILTDIGRLADEIAFLVDGRLMQRSSKDDLMDAWRRVTFRKSGDLVTPAGTVSHEREESSHRIVSSDFTATLQDLRAQGVDSMQDTRMSIDEIAVEILKGGKNVAHS
jgi:ABC-2 type transport system ATP-binding protein